MKLEDGTAAAALCRGSARCGDGARVVAPAHLPFDVHWVDVISDQVESLLLRLTHARGSEGDA